MIRVTIDQDEMTGRTEITAAVPPPVALAIVINAYHALLSAKIRDEIHQASRIMPAPDDMVSRIVR